MRRAGLHYAAGLFFVMACRQGGTATPDSGLPDVTLTNPAIVSLTRTCDVEQGEWVIEAETDAWSGGMTSWWSLDGEVIERHRIPVFESEPDGTYDRLFTTLNIVSDWRDQSNNASTRFRCTEEVSTLFWLENLQGQRVACSVAGDPAPVSALAGVDACP